MAITPLQKAFAKSKILRRAMAEYLHEEGIPAGKGYKRLWNGICYDVFSQMTEAQIKSCLYSFMACDDLTDAERDEIRHLLQLSTTALTAPQLARE